MHLHLDYPDDRVKLHLFFILNTAELDKLGNSQVFPKITPGFRRKSQLLFVMIVLIKFLKTWFFITRLIVDEISGCHGIKKGLVRR